MALTSQRFAHDHFTVQPQGYATVFGRSIKGKNFHEIIISQAMGSILAASKSERNFADELGFVGLLDTEAVIHNAPLNF